MPNIRPFKALCPQREYADKVYISHGIGGDDEKSLAVMTTNPFNMLHVSNPELKLPEFQQNDEAFIQEKAHEYLTKLCDDGVLLQDEEECFYVYRLTKGDHKQTGLIACTEVADYLSGRIKKHELTRVEKTAKQIKLLERIGGYMEPAFLSYDSRGDKHLAFEEWADSHESLFGFFDEYGTRHELWRISDGTLISEIQDYFRKKDSFYICDGHHRISAAAEYSKKDPEDNRLFLSVIFPSEETMILDYNRGVMDLHGMDSSEFLRRLEASDFSVEPLGTEAAPPKSRMEFTMIIDGLWYRLKYRGIVNEEDPVDRLDVSILQERVIKDILGIENPQSDERLAFISGTKGLEGLSEVTRKGMKVAFAISPVTMEEIMEVADAGMTMPPKSTCFEPKPVMGIILYQA